MQPTISNHTSADEVISSLENLNLQSRPFDFADEASSGGLGSPTQPQAADTYTLPLQYSSPAIEDVSPSAVPTATGNLAVPSDSPTASADRCEEQLGGRLDVISSAAAPNDNAEAGQGSNDIDVAGPEEDAVPINYVSRRTTDPYMEKKLRGLQVCFGRLLCVHIAFKPDLLVVEP